MKQERTKAKRRPPASLFAIGDEPPPEIVEAGGRRYRFVRLFKHDFFAMTALYAAESSGEVAEQAALPSAHAVPAEAQAVLKVQRDYPYYGLPLSWLGRIIARHEISIYQRLQGVRGVPRFLGRVGATGFLHEFVPGEDLRADLPLTQNFFSELETLFQELHARNIAYVDSNKRENILYGEDGKPWLIDFQISFDLRHGDTDNSPARWIFRRLARSDWYHFYKHKTRLLPSACTPEDFVRAENRGLLHQLHRLIARPMIQIRRRILSRYDLANSR